MQTVTPELHRWMIAQAESGCRPDAIVAEMQKIGWSEAQAIVALDRALQARLSELNASRNLPSAATAMPEPFPAETPRAVTIGDAVVSVRVAVRHPRVIVFDNFLSVDECDALIALATPRLDRSRTVGGEGGANVVHATRTSEGMFFTRGETPLIEAIETRISQLVHWPVENGEGLQVLRYSPGGAYSPHFDYFELDEPGTEEALKRGGQRVGTLLLYLNDPTRGGATTFPDAGIEVVASKGSAVFFSYDRPHPSTKSLHAGAPLLEGVKWVATKWFRERETR